MIGEQLSAILVEIEKTLWEFEDNVGLKPNYTEAGFKAGIKIFSSVLMDKIFELQNDESMPIEDRLNMATKAGEEIRKLVKTYTNLDTKTFYEKKV